LITVGDILEQRILAFFFCGDEASMKESRSGALLSRSRFVRLAEKPFFLTCVAWTADSKATETAIAASA
jgi:hypothetical protein